MDTLKNIIKLDDFYLEKFNNLAEKADLEQIIDFSDKVAQKQQNIEFLEKITYSEIAKHVQERSELHKYLEHMLWVFGEQYNGTTNLLSDKSLEKNLKTLRDQYLEYQPSIEDDNINEIDVEEVKSITDLFIYSEKIIDEEKREVLIVELKAPKVKISIKELNQVQKYAFQIEDSPNFSDRINYKILLVSSELNKQAKSTIKGTSKGKANPYYYWSNDLGNIQIEVMKWSDIIEVTKRKLKYLSNNLSVKDKSILNSIEDEFSDVESTKLKSTLRKSRPTL